MPTFVSALIWFVVIFGAFIAFILYASSPKVVAAQEAADARQAKLVCPHCNTSGSVTSARARRKRGISGGKATGAVLTGGVSMLATGLSRKEDVTTMHCANCGTSWDVV